MQRKEQRKNSLAAAAEAPEGSEIEPPVKKQRTEEEEKECVGRLGGTFYSDL